MSDRGGDSFSRWLPEFARPVGPVEREQSGSGLVDSGSDDSRPLEPGYAASPFDLAEPERPAPPPKRVRVVLAERRRARRVVRTLAEVEEQTGVGEMLVRDLIRAQLTVSLWLAVFVAVTVGAIPVLFYFARDLSDASLFGIQLPWLVLGLAIYPFLIGVGWVSVRLANRNEQHFMNLVED